MVVESAEHALKRGATPIAEILGGALTADAFHISAPDPSGRGQARAMTSALRNSGVAPDEIDWIVAHGTSTSLNDSTETRAIKAAYGSAAHTRAVSSPKSMIGHLVGAAGIASALAALGGIRDGVIAADRQSPHARTPSATSTTCRSWRARRRSTRSPSTASASAARTRCRSSAASRRSPSTLARQARSGRPSNASSWVTTSDEISRGRLRVVVQDLDALGRRDEPRVAHGRLPGGDPVLERERRPPDSPDPGLDGQHLAEVDGRAERDPDVGEDQRLLRPVGDDRMGSPVAASQYAMRADSQ